MWAATNYMIIKYVLSVKAAWFDLCGISRCWARNQKLLFNVHIFFKSGSHFLHEKQYFYLAPCLFWILPELYAHTHTHTLSQRSAASVISLCRATFIIFFFWWRDLEGKLKMNARPQFAKPNKNCINLKLLHLINIPNRHLNYGWVRRQESVAPLTCSLPRAHL